MWKTRLEELRLPTGPWLTDLKRQVRAGAADSTPITVRWRDRGGSREQTHTLGDLKRRVLEFVPGQRVAYVTDVAGHEQNRARLVDFLKAVDLLFIEAVFLQVDADHANARRTSRRARPAVSPVPRQQRLPCPSTSPRATWAGKQSSSGNFARPTTMSEVTWYFDFVSPYSYFALQSLHRLPAGVSVVLQPVLFAGLLNHWGQKGPAEIEPKRVWTYRSCVWIAQREGWPFRLPARHPFNPLPYLRLAIAAERRPAAIRTIFERLWTRGDDPADPALMTELSAPTRHCSTSASPPRT